MPLIYGTNFNDNNTVQPIIPGLPFANFFPALNGTIFDDAIFGFLGDDILFGWFGNDLLDGGEGADLLDGGEGVDTLKGGAGNDTYVVDNVGDTVTEDTNDTLGGTDTVNSTVSFTLGFGLENLNLTGTGNIDATGNDNKNIINGNSGANKMDGGAGGDYMNGGDGNDTYTVDNIGDVVFEINYNPSGGIDTVNAYIDYTLGSTQENLNLLEFDLAHPVGFGGHNGTGNALNNVINGNSYDNVLSGLAGNDTINGGDGNDTYYGGDGNDILTDIEANSFPYTFDPLNLPDGSPYPGGDYLDGGAGADSMTGGTGNDTYIVDNVGDVVYESSNRIVTVSFTIPFPIPIPPYSVDVTYTLYNTNIDTVNASVSYTLGSFIENLNLTGSAAIDGTGNDLDNVINGNAADNTLSGGNGNDVLNGGVGADIMSGGDGNDTYFVDNNSDVVLEDFNNGLGGIDSVNSSVTFSLLGSDIENLTLTGIANIDGIGNEKNNIITGNASANTLDGGAGADTMNGGDGNDTYIVDNTLDVIVGEINNFLGGIDIVNASVTYTLMDALENLTLTGIADINGTGNANNNIITGNDGVNTLDGGDGNDNLIGGLGNDILLGGNGNDILNGGAGADSMTGGLGNDVYNVGVVGDAVFEVAGVGSGVDTVNASISYTLGANVENLGLFGVGNFNGTGNSLNNVIKGNAANNTLNGGAGNDSLVGNAGNDTLLGGNGNDALQGGLGNDFLTGGLGNDNLNGGAGLDTFFFNTALGAGNVDTITGYSVVDDTIRLENAIFTSVGAAGALNATMFKAGGIQDANDFILYNTTTGALSYDADANGAGAAVQFATLVGVPPLTAADFVVV